MLAQRSNSLRNQDSNMKQKATFYHAGCPVCVTAEESLLGALDRSRLDVEVVHLGIDKNRIAEAKAAGVQSVPALVIAGQALHVNFGAPIGAL
jgi:glutaredoxin